jgi:serine/threonine protein kinase
MISNIKIGDMIGSDFKVIDICGGEGKSGMGIVYVCLYAQLNVIIALKTFQDKFINFEEIKESFKQEAKIWINLESHPNIVNAGTFEIIDDRPFIYMEFIAPDGYGRKTLEDYIKTNLSNLQILDWAIQFCYAMEHAKSHNVTPHRDIKPANIMITREEKLLKITDFGLAKIWDNERFNIFENNENLSHLMILKDSTNDSIAGTPPWMAPEQFDGNAIEKSDIYSFGVVLYQMINQGELPFIAKTFEQFEEAHKNNEIPVIDSELFPIIKKCLNKNPDDRYGDFKELREKLEQLYSDTGNNPYSPKSINLSADRIIGKAYGLERLGYKKEALVEYQKIVEIDSNSFYTRINAGAGFNRLNIHDEAILEFSKAIELEPTNAMAHYNLGNALYNSGKFNEAVNEYEKSIEIDSLYIECHVNYGNLLRDMGKFKESINHLNTALELDPNFFKAKVNLGITLYNIGDFEEAYKKFEEAEKINPNSPELYYHWGVSLSENGKENYAILKYIKSLSLNTE